MQVEAKNGIIRPLPTKGKGDPLRTISLIFNTRAEVCNEVAAGQQGQSPFHLVHTTLVVSEILSH